MKKQSQGYRIWKAIELAAGARAEAVSDNSESDAIVGQYVTKLIAELIEFNTQVDAAVAALKGTPQNEKSGIFDD